jgi:hypothetical protein
LVLKQAAMRPSPGFTPGQSVSMSCLQAPATAAFGGGGGGTSAQTGRVTQAAMIEAPMTLTAVEMTSFIDDSFQVN